MAKDKLWGIFYEIQGYAKYNFLKNKEWILCIKYALMGNK